MSRSLKRPVRLAGGSKSVHVGGHTRRTPTKPTSGTHRLGTLPKGATTHSRAGRKPQGPRHSAKLHPKRKYNGKIYRFAEHSTTKSGATARADRHRSAGKNKLARVEKVAKGWAVYIRG